MIWQILTWPIRERPWLWRPFCETYCDKLFWRLIPNLTIYIDWQNDEYDFDAIGMEACWLVWTVQVGLADND